MLINKIFTLVVLYVCSMEILLGQNIKKVINIDSMQTHPAFAEEFYVLTSDSTIKHGTYKKVSGNFHDKGTILAEGNYENGKKNGLWQTRFSKGHYKDDEKIGLWQYYNYANKIELEYDYDTNQIITFLSNSKYRFQILDNNKFIESNLDTIPIYKGFSESMSKLNDNLRYPQAAVYQKITGDVLVFIIIDTSGKIVGHGVEKGVHSSLDTEALRILKLAINGMTECFIPAKKNGKTVTVKMLIPIRFRLI
jgi:TonB family protein